MRRAYCNETKTSIQFDGRFFGFVWILIFLREFIRRQKIVEIDELMIVNSISFQRPNFAPFPNTVKNIENVIDEKMNVLLNVVDVRIQNDVRIEKFDVG